MSSCSSQGAQSRLLFKAGGSPHDFSTGAVRFDFTRESLTKEGRIVSSRGITGTRSQLASRVREGAYPVGGHVSFDPSPKLLDSWLPCILGADESNDTFALAETLPSFGLLVDKVGGIFEYQDGLVDQAVLRGQAGPDDENAEIVSLDLALRFKDELTTTSWPGTPPSLGNTLADQFYILSDAVCTIAGSARKILRFQLAINNHLQTRWTNSLKASCISPRDRTVSLGVLVPFTATEMNAFYGKQVPGGAASLAFTNGDVSTTFTFDQLTIPSRTPTVQGKQEILMWLVGQAFMDDAAEVSVSNDSAA